MKKLLHVFVVGGHEFNYLIDVDGFLYISDMKGIRKYNGWCSGIKKDMSYNITRLTGENLSELLTSKLNLKGKTVRASQLKVLFQLHAADEKEVILEQDFVPGTKIRPLVLNSRQTALSIDENGFLWRGNNKSKSTNKKVLVPSVYNGKYYYSLSVLKKDIDVNIIPIFLYDHVSGHAMISVDELAHYYSTMPSYGLPDDHISTAKPNLQKSHPVVDIVVSPVTTEKQVSLAVTPQVEQIVSEVSSEIYGNKWHEYVPKSKRVVCKIDDEFMEFDNMQQLTNYLSTVTVPSDVVVSVFVMHGEVLVTPPPTQNTITF